MGTAGPGWDGGNGGRQDQVGIGGDQGKTGTASNGGNGDIRIRLGLGSRTQGTEEGRTPSPDWDRVTGGTRIRLGLGSRTPAMEELGTPGPIWDEGKPQEETGVRAPESPGPGWDWESGVQGMEG